MSNKKARIKTKNLISLGLYSLMLRHNYDEISVKDICEKAGVSRMSFYRYYNNKDDIFKDFGHFCSFGSAFGSIWALLANS